LVTYDGQLPWSFVTRREFLQKRKRFLQRQMAAEAPRLKEQLASWEQQKKYKEQELKSDPTRLASYISGTHNPAIEREQAAFKRLMTEYENALAKIDDQLSASEQELNKNAIVIKSTQNNFDYAFTDKMEPFAELLTKPNPSYFKKGLQNAVPQMIVVSIKYDPKSPVTTGFASEMEKNLNLDYIKSFIGKTVPGTVPAGAGTFPGSAPTRAENSSNNSTQASIQSNAVETTSNPSVNNTAKSSQANNKSPNAAGKSSNSSGTSGTPGKSIQLSGTLSAPAGVPVTLNYNEANVLTITPPKGEGNLYNTTAIRFTKPIKENEEYTVSLKKIASNMKGVVYNGKGKGPDEASKIKIGVDYTYELITRSSNEKVFSTFYESSAPAIGGYGPEEGRYVVFISYTKDFEGSTGKFRQVYWRDRNTGATKLISANTAGEAGNGDCAEPSISADGKSVVFESRANNLVPGDNNNFKDVFLWSASTNTLELVSKSTTNGSSDGDNFDAQISGNGQYVAFSSSAANLSAVPKGRSVTNIYLRDLKNEKTEMISIDPIVKTGGNGYKCSISFDGSRVSFCSSNGTLVQNDNNNLWDIFLWERNQKLKRVSLTHEGKERNGGSESASRQVASVISGNGKFIVFATTATNMVPNDNNTFQDVFVVEVEAGKVTVASFTEDNQPSNGDSPIEQGERLSISYDGTWIAFPTKATNLGAESSNIILHNRLTGKKTAASNVKGSYVGRPSISYNGGYVLFGKSANLDSRYASSGIFANFTGNGGCRDCR
jgi:hypothetical protein